MKYTDPGTRTEYYLKPGQTLQNTKVSDRSLALIVSEQVYNRFNQYSTENERIALLAEREAKRMDALREAGREMLEAQGFKNIYKKETIDSKKKRDEETVEFMKQVKAQKDKEHAEIVKKAREKIFSNATQCRSFNRALLLSECMKELDEQIKFQNNMKIIDQKLADEYAKSVMKDVEKFWEEERVKSEARLKKIQTCKLTLERQIKANQEKKNSTSEAIKKQELENMENTAKELKELEEKEREEEFQNREALKKMFLTSIEQKRQRDLKVERENELGMKVLQTYNTFKCQMEKMKKEKIKQVGQRKINAAENLARKLMRQKIKEKGTGPSPDEITERVAERIEQEAVKRIADEKRKKEEIRQEIREQKKIFDENKTKQKKEEMELRLWEMQQRYARNEFYKNWTLEQKQNEKNKKLAYGKLLKIQMEDNNYLKKKEAMEEATMDLIWRKEMLEKCNEKTLAYGEKIIKDSEGVRSTFPIRKAINQFKKEAGLFPRNTEQNIERPAVKSKKRAKRQVCAPIKEEKIFHFG